MTVDTPTQDEGASVTERIERYLSAGEAQEPTKPQTEEASGQESAPEPVETEAQEPESGEQEQDEGPQIQLSDVARFLGVDESALDVSEEGEVFVRTKIDGKEGAAKFNELLKSYQLQGHVDAKAREVAESYRAQQERVQQFEAYAQQKAQDFEQIYNAAYQLMLGEFGGVNWAEMASSDPIGYVEKQAKYNQRVQQLQGIKDAADRERAAYMQAQQYQATQKLQSEMQRLSTLIPEWQDESKRNAELPQLVNWLKSQGANPNTIAALDNSAFADAGLIRALRIGMLAEAGKSKEAITQKKVISAPKLVKPGAPVGKAQREAESLKALKDNIRKSGGKGNSIAEYLIAAGKV